MTVRQTPDVPVKDYESVVSSQVTSETGTPTSIASSMTSQVFLAANPDRLGVSVENDSTAILYVLLGPGAASLTRYTVALCAKGAGPGGYFETPFNYTGPISGVWDAVNGSARITEFT